MSRRCAVNAKEVYCGLYKTELIKPRKPWHSLADVELATAEWVDWFNNQRLHTAIGDIPPHEHETNYYAHVPGQICKPTRDTGCTAADFRHDAEQGHRR
ncbi:integrase core domain-containing protein [Streptomyces sp. NPDC058086]|uniref:integrase core domain-containing protein n=1 Tax=Streptomyces sp. NPDC058086 TaxID=3346334 RepID=UPI0036EBD1F3